MYLSIWLCICLSVYPFYQSVSLSVCPSVCLSVCLCLCVRPSAYLLISLLAYLPLPTQLPAHLLASIYLSVYLSVPLSLSLWIIFGISLSFFLSFLLSFSLSLSISISLAPSLARSTCRGDENNLVLNIAPNFSLPNCSLQCLDPPVNLTEVRGLRMWEFPKIRGTLFWGPYNEYYIRVPYFRKPPCGVQATCSGAEVRGLEGRSSDSRSCVLLVFEVWHYWLSCQRCAENRKGNWSTLSAGVRGDCGWLGVQLERLPWDSGVLTSLRLNCQSTLEVQKCGDFPADQSGAARSVPAMLIPPALGSFYSPVAFRSCPA